MYLNVFIPVRNIVVMIKGRLQELGTFQSSVCCAYKEQTESTFRGNPLSNPEHFGRISVMNVEEEIMFISYFRARCWGLRFQGSTSHILWEMAVDGASGFDQSKSACSTETLFGALGINAWHPGLLLSPLCANEAVSLRGVSNSSFPGLKWEAFREKHFS